MSLEEKERKEEIAKTPEAFNCAIGLTKMTNPFFLPPTYHPYEKESVQSWLKDRHKHPYTRGECNKAQLISHRALKKAIEEYDSKAVDYGKPQQLFEQQLAKLEAELKQLNAELEALGADQINLGKYDNKRAAQGPVVKFRPTIINAFSRSCAYPFRPYLRKTKAAQMD